MFKSSKYCLAAIIALSSFSLSVAQEAEPNTPQEVEEYIDEIIVEGMRSWEGHDGMDAFSAGDYETAEIEFEQEFKSLRRRDSARENAALSADIGFDRAQSIGDASVGGQSSGGPGGSSAAFSQTGGTPDLGIEGGFSSKRSKGRNILNDGNLNYEDFAFTKYMSGLSELQLGKYEEAKDSFKRSLSFNGRNYDARMRLGLLHIVQRNLDKAADQLEALEKLRIKCEKKSCNDYQEILESSKILANSITKAIQSQ